MDEEILAEMNKIIKEFDCAKKMKTGVYTPKRFKKRGAFDEPSCFFKSTE